MQQYQDSRQYDRQPVGFDSQPSNYNYGNGISHNNAPQRDSDSTFYNKVLGWLFVSFALAFVGTMIIGPLVPPALMMPLNIAVIGILLVSGFVRNVKGLNTILGLVVPTVLGIVIYPAINYYIASGNSDIITMALAGTAVTFGSAAVFGWFSKKSISGISGILFGIVLGLIALSLINVFFLQMTIISFLISCAVLVIFTIYSYIDIQHIRDRSLGNLPASAYSLNIFLDIFNIFVSLLNILGILSRD